MSKSDDMHKIRNLRCPHCHSPVEPSWNLETTGKVLCMSKCKKGRFLMDPNDCVDISDEEALLCGVEDLEDIKTEEE